MKSGPRLPSPLGALPLVWQGLFFGVPVILALGLSLQLWSVTTIVASPGFGAYADMLTQPAVRAAIGNSLGLAATVATISALMALPLARGIVGIEAPALRAAVLLVMALPFFSSSLLRMFGWYGWLNGQGILTWLQGGGPPAQGLLNNGFATGLGLVSLLLPLCSLLLSLAFLYMDPTLVAAARNLGAGPLRCFREVELPFVLPALIAGWQFAFLTAMGDMVAGSILGGNLTYYLSTAIADQVKNDAWSLASAQAVTLMCLSVTFMVMTFTLVRRTRIMAMTDRS